jgi:plasmid stability protein
VGVDDFDHHVAHHGRTTEDEAHQREDLRQLMSDVSELPESQRTALMLREIDALSYEQIAEAMETTVPSVKSLLVRARGGLAEAAEARLISCEEARQEMTEAAEGLTKVSAPVRRHTRDCERCTGYRAALKQNNKALALLLPIGPILLIKKLIIAHIGTSVGAGGAAASTASSGMLSGAIGSVAVKTAATVAAAALVTAGAVEVKQATTASPLRQSASAVVSPAVVASAAVAPRTESLAGAKAAARKKASAVKPAPIVQPTIEPTSPAVVVVSPVTPPVAETPTVTTPAAPPVIVEEHHGEAVLEQTTEPVEPTPPVDPEPPVKPQSEDDAAAYSAP